MRCLLGDIEHRSDLGPRPVSFTRGPDRVDQRRVDLIAMLCELRDAAERIRVGDHEIVWPHAVSPLLERQLVVLVSWS